MHINTCLYFKLLFLLLFSLAPQSFAGLSVEIKGKVTSYNEDVYKIQTARAVITLKRSHLSQPLMKELQITGRQINLSIPASAILSRRPLKASKSHKKKRPYLMSNQEPSIDRDKASVKNKKIHQKQRSK